MVEEVGIIGGVLEFALIAGFVVYALLVKPFRPLDLAVSFSALKEQICRVEGLTDQSDPPHEFSEGFDCSFYLYWYF